MQVQTIIGNSWKMRKVKFFQENSEHLPEDITGEG
jgi:hypothetical protein